MRKTFYQKNKAVFDKFDGLLLENPILDRGLILAPVIVASISYKNSFVLGMAFIVITFFTVLISSFIPKKIPYTLRIIMYTVIAGLVYIPTSLWLNKYYPETILSIGVFFPLLIANSLIVIKSESRFHKRKIGNMMLDLLCNGVGFFLVIILVGIIREFLGSGTFLGNPVTTTFTARAVLLPFSGFIIVGFLAAIVKNIKYHLENPRERDEESEDKAI